MMVPVHGSPVSILILSWALVSAIIWSIVDSAEAGAQSIETTAPLLERRSNKEPDLGGQSAEAEHEPRGSSYKRQVDDGRTSYRTNERRRAKSSSQLPEFAAPIGNVTAVLGRDARLACIVDNLGQYTVAWLKEEAHDSKTLISIDANIIISNYRIFLIPDEEERKWVLHIEKVRESDRGFYQCQVNTNPPRTISGYLEVVVPPSIVESQSSQTVEAEEGANLTLQCQASGQPKPTISWRRDDGNPIKLLGSPYSIQSRDNHETPATSSLESPHSLQLLADIKSDKLALTNVDRTMAGLYTCQASNNVHAPAIKKVPVYVKFAPKTSIANKSIALQLGDQLDVDCLIEAFPRANSYWSKKAPFGYGSSAMRAAGHTMARLYRDRGGLSRVLEQPVIRWQARQEEDQDEGERNGRLHTRNQVAPQTRNSNPSRRHLDQSAPDQGSHFRTTEGGFGADSPSSAKSPFVVKQTAINSYTYKLRLSIGRLQAEHFGQYICIANNSYGISESYVLVRRALPNVEADETREQRDEAPLPRDGLDSSGHGSRQDARRAQSSAEVNRGVVYDENYLQAIKARERGASNSNIRQQRLKSRPSNSAACPHTSGPFLLAFSFLIVSNVWTLNSPIRDQMI